MWNVDDQSQTVDEEGRAAEFEEDKRSIYEHTVIAINRLSPLPPSFTIHGEATHLQLADGRCCIVRLPPFLTSETLLQMGGDRAVDVLGSCRVPADPRMQQRLLATEALFRIAAHQMRDEIFRCKNQVP